MGEGRCAVSPYSMNSLLVLIYVSPVNPKELYNLRHASAHNVVERIFGVLKQRFGYVLCVLSLHAITDS